MIARAALVVVLAGAFGATVPAGTCLAASPGAGTAGVIVEYDELHTSEFCVRVDEDARALDLLAGTGLELTVQDHGGDRLTLCRIGGVGCNRDDCFCSCRNAEGGCTFWGVYTLGARGDWRFSLLGVGELRIKAGEVLGLRWSVQTSAGGAAPLTRAPHGVCSRVALVATSTRSEQGPGRGTRCRRADRDPGRRRVVGPARAGGHMSLHPVAWLAWFVAAGTVVLVMDDPWTSALAIAAAVFVGARVALSGPEGRSWRLMLRLGFLFLAVRVILFALTGHTGPTILFTVPRTQLPAWLGGFGIGGPITGEVVAQAGSEGLKIAALLLACGVALSVVPLHRMMRALPRYAFEAGLVIGIAVAFVPTLLRAAADVRDAQRLRGHRFRGLRSLRPLVVPILEAALERSMTLAASMETRGFGRARSEPMPAARALVTGGAIALSGGGALAMFGRPIGALIGAAGVCALVAGLRVLGAGHARTRYRPDRIGPWDIALIACALAAIAVAASARAAGAGGWYAYPAVSWPPVGAGTIAATLTLIAPALLTSARRTRFVQASERQPEMVGVAP